MGRLLRNWKWPLPYKSTIVVPICPIEENTLAGLVGFLCVDSTRNLAFKKDYDVELLLGIAEGIYNTVREMLSEQNKSS